MSQHATPLVSIVVPAFEAQAHIAAAVESALAQTWRNIELIIAPDDGRAYAELRLRWPDPRLRILRPGSHRGSGPGPTRNRAIDAARGEFLTALDADDLIVPTHIEALTQVAMAEGAALAPLRYTAWDPSRLVRALPLPADTLDLRSYGRLLASLHPLHHRSLETGYSTGFAEDVVHDGLVIARSGSVRLAARAGYLLRSRPGSLTQAGPEAEEGIQASYARRIEQILQRPTELGMQVLDIATRQSFAELFRLRLFVSRRFAASGQRDYNTWLAGREAALCAAFDEKQPLRGRMTIGR